MILHQSKKRFWKNIDLNVKIGKTDIKKTNSYKYLGINIDRNLNWSEHIETIKTKLQKTLGVLYKTRHFLNEKALYLLFNSLLISNVRYGLLCWGRANKKCINDINVLINRALRCIHYMKYDDSVRKLKTEKKILNVESLYLYELGIFMFKFKNNLLPANFNCYFKSIKNIHNYHTRSSEINFFLPRFNNSSGHKLLAYQGSRLWTMLPIYLKNLTNIGKFQDELKNYLLNSDYQDHK